MNLKQAKRLRAFVRTLYDGSVELGAKAPLPKVEKVKKHYATFTNPVTGESRREYLGQTVTLYHDKTPKGLYRAMKRMSQ